MKLEVKVKDYDTHLAIKLIADGVQVGWIQFEGDNFAFYGMPQDARCYKDSSVYVTLPSVEYTKRIKASV